MNAIKNGRQPSSQRFFRPFLAAAWAVLPAWAGVLSSGCFGPGHGGSFPVPLTHEARELLRNADTDGLAEGPAGTFPMSRKEAARMTRQLAERAGEKSYPAEYLQEEFESELGGGPFARDWRDMAEFRIIERPYIRAEYVEGQYDSWNDYGRRYGEGWAVRAGMRSELLIGNWFAVSIAPEVCVAQSGPMETDRGWRGDNIELAARVFIKKWEIEAGRDSLWWGAGTHGALLVSNNTRPMDIVKLSNHEPILLPWALSRLGPMRFCFFVTTLDEKEDRPAIGRPYFSGMRLEFRPHPNFSFAMERTAIFGGDDVVTDGELLWNVFWGIGENKASGPNGDQKAGLEVRWRHKGFEFYAEVAGEDQAGYRPSKLASILGISSRLGSPCGRPLRFRAEWADNTWGGKNLWYHHGRYGWKAYYYHDRVIGHHMGPDSNDIYLELSWGPLKLWADIENHGILDAPSGSSPSEQEIGMQLEANIAGQTVVFVKYAFQEYSDYLPTEGIQPGTDEQASYVAFGLSSRF